MLAEGKVLGVPGSEELQGHFHDFFAAKLTARKVVEDKFTVLGKQLLAFGNTVDVGFVEFEPPVRFQLCEG